MTGEHGQIRIHKYGNRRLYRTDESRYVTLSEIALMVREHRDFMVTDAKSGKDLTALVLAQVILDEEKRDVGGAFPVALLQQLIRLRDERLTDFVVSHLPRLTALYLRTVEATHSSLDEATVGDRTYKERLSQQLETVREQLGDIALELSETPD